ncbi:MAG: methyltransferase domain-containing protein [Magnetococcales bacterium]|nr:methyltransferase domain-containing protein [Magnetococcales bacterium]MBF0149731.1 methyltransferase domain-containing protein [Magnetococcales bacterium]MBF0347613.1 methyltransferase domain-containing protein [Magnetococcales bacterium]
MRMIPIQPVSDESTLEFARVRHAWERAGKQGSDVWQRSLINRVGEWLVERLLELRMQPAMVLDLGCRSGILRERLKQSEKNIPRVVSASFAESCAITLRGHQGPFTLFKKRPAVTCLNPLALPFATHTFDAILSNMALHWIGDRKGALREIRRVLKPEGVFLFTMSGAETLMELRDCLATVDQQRWQRTWPRIPQFPTLHQLGDELFELGFRLPVVDREVIHPTFADTRSLIRHLRTLGGCNPHSDQKNTLTGRQFFTEVQTLYQSRHAPTQKPLPVTVEILFGHGWRSA